MPTRCHGKYHAQQISFDTQFLRQLGVFDDQPHQVQHSLCLQLSTQRKTAPLVDTLTFL